MKETWKLNQDFDINHMESKLFYSNLLMMRIEKRF